MEFTEVESSDIICVDFGGGRIIKIVDEYGNIDFFGIKDNLKNIEEIIEVSDIFTHLIGIPDGWEIIDFENLYTLNPLPSQFWNTDKNPPCYESESESYMEIDEDSGVRRFFDSTIQNF